VVWVHGEVRTPPPVDAPLAALGANTIAELNRNLVALAKAAAKPASGSNYLRGDCAGSNYLGLADPQGRTFRRWADINHLPFALVGSVRTYRKSDIDRLWVRTAFNLPLHQRTAV
jgi:hypothetical protein